MKKAFIKVINPKQAEGNLEKAYRRVGGERGNIANIHQCQSLNPRAMIKHLDFYMTLMYGDSPLSRVQRELIGAVVSYFNNCEYCIVHHYEALLHNWRGAPSIEKLTKGEGLSDKEFALVNFSKELTINPDSITETNYNSLKQKGYTDREILDITMIVGYFNFVNRLVLGVGVKLEPHTEREYKY